jgi:hypothetical protein
MTDLTVPYCLFPPVADFFSKTDLRIKLEDQFKKQTQLVPAVPSSIKEAIDSRLSHWLPSHIEDIVHIEMCETEIADPNNPDEKISRYYLEAAKYAGRISAGNFDDVKSGKYKPIFEIHHNDFTPRIQAELELLLKGSPSTLRRVIQNAVFRIFMARHKRIFFEYIQSEDLNWRFIVAD